MDKERAKIIDKAKKLKELADRGVGGEKENAKRMYDAYKKKHNLTDEDVKGHKYSDDFIKEFANMTDEEALEAIGKGLIILGVGLLFSFLSDIISEPSKKEKARRNNETKKRATELNKMVTHFKNKKNNPKKDEDDIPETDEQKEIMKEIELNLKKDKKNES